MSILQPYSFTQRGNRYFFEFSVNVLNAVDILIYPYDERIEATIVHILSMFFEDNKNSLIYVCDNLGNRQQARFRKFHSWFKKSKTNNIEKYDVVFNALEMQILASLIVHTQNPDKDLLVSLFLGLYK